MTIRDRVGQQQVFEDALGGNGKGLAYAFFQGQIGHAVSFAEYVSQPGSYAGYHRHKGSRSIMYVLSGKAEHFQEGERCTLEAGEAILVTSGQAHAIRNVGDEDCRLLEFFYLEVPGDDHDLGSTLTPLPLPEAPSDWEWQWSELVAELAAATAQPSTSHHMPPAHRASLATASQ
jgi:quercetin dioxygenase-like cupin family protein